MSSRRSQKIKIPGVSPLEARPAIAEIPAPAASCAPRSASQRIPWLLVVSALGMLGYLGDLTLLDSPETPLALSYFCLFTLAVFLGLRGLLFRWAWNPRWNDPALALVLGLILLNCGLSFYHHPGPYAVAVFALLAVAAGGLVQTWAWWVGMTSGITLVFLGLAWQTGLQELPAYLIFAGALVLSLAFQHFGVPGRVSPDGEAVVEESPRNLLQAALLSGSVFEGIVVHERGIIREANSAAIAMFGYSAQEFKGLNITHLLTRESRALSRESLLLGNFHPLEVSCLRRNGGIFQAQLSSRALGFQGRDFMLAVIRDVSDRKRLESELEEGRRQLESFRQRQAALTDIERRLKSEEDLSSLLTPIARAASQFLPATLGAHIVIRDAAANSLRLETSSSILPAAEGLMPEFTPGPATDWILDHGESLVISDTAADPFGMGRVFPGQDIQAYAGIPIQNEETVIGLLFVLENRPRILRKEELDFLDTLAAKAALVLLKVQWTARLRDTQRQLDQHRADLERALFDLANLRESGQASRQQQFELLLRISRDLHRPVGELLGVTHLLLLSSLTGEQRRFAENIRDHANLLLQRADVIQDFARANTGETTVKTLDFDLHEILKNAVRFHLNQAQKKHIELSFQVSREVPRSLRGDAVRLEQVLSHLLDNAIRFTDQGQVIVSASRLPGVSSNVLLRFEVRDTGTGISPEEQAGLFVPCGLPDNPKTGGLGLSLFVCRHLVSLMHGEIGVSSEAGVGSTFWFTVAMEESSILHN